MQHSISSSCPDNLYVALQIIVRITLRRFSRLLALFNHASTLGQFRIPTQLVGRGNEPNRRNQIIYDGTNYEIYKVAFLDNALFNGREEMAVRVMDIDLDLLRKETIGGDTWLPMGGIVYAFREDAVREDGIARPAIAGKLDECCPCERQSPRSTLGR